MPGCKSFFELGKEFFLVILLKSKFLLNALQLLVEQELPLVLANVFLHLFTNRTLQAADLELLFE